MSKTDGTSIEASPNKVLCWLGPLSAGLAAIPLFCLCFAGFASAEVNPTFFQELPTTQQHAATDFFYEQSPQSTVPYEGGAAELSESMSHTYESQSESQPFYDELVGDINEVGQDDELFPPVEEAVPEIWAADGAFMVGWKIGEGIHALFADIGLGFGSAPEYEYIPEYSFCYSEKCGGRLNYVPYGTPLWEGDGVQQHPGAYIYSGTLYWYGEPGPGWFIDVRWFNGPCEFSALNPPPGATVQEFVPTGYECWDRSTEKALPMYEVYPYVSIQKLLSHEEFHHYDPLIDPTPGWESKAPENPGTAVAEEKVAESIDESEFEQAWIGQAEEPEPKYESFPAPTATEREVKEEDRKCERGTPTFTNIEGNSSPEPFAQKESLEFTVAKVPESEAGAGPVYLRYGETKWRAPESPGAPGYIDNWGGWGYRHIVAKHGWGPLDRVETEEALASAIPEETKRGTWLYELLDSTPGEGGIDCTRRVVVDFVHKENNPASRGIVTSYNVAGKPEE